MDTTMRHIRSAVAAVDAILNGEAGIDGMAMRLNHAVASLDCAMDHLDDLDGAHDVRKSPVRRARNLLDDDVDESHAGGAVRTVHSRLRVARNRLGWIDGVDSFDLNA